MKDINFKVEQGDVVGIIGYGHYGMNANKRIAINAIATYSRTLLRMALGLFSGRWVLQSLGEVDYGLMGVVGSLIVFITFLNTVISGACARFFAYSIGKNDIDDLIRWFNVGLSVHFFLALFIVAFGAPIGEWAIDYFLNIPSDRLLTAHWVFRFSLIAAFWTMSTTPYIAMFTATQNIAEATFWDITSIFINFGFAYWLTTYQGDSWLVFAGFTVALRILLGIGMVLHAKYAFPGCRIKYSYWKEWKRIRQMLSYSGWTLFGNLGYMARTQLPAVLLNQYYPPIKFKYVNASYSIGGALANYTQSLSGSLKGAFSPQIATLAGANDKDGMVKTALRASKYGTFLMLLFAIPLALEADYLLVLWLKNPPQLAADFCRLVIVQLVLDNITFGHMSGILACGNIKWYQITTGSLCVLSVPIAWLVLELGGNPISVSWVIAISMGMCSVARLFFGRSLLGVGIKEWAKRIFVPISIIIILSLSVGCVILLLMPNPSFLRMFITGVTSCITMVILAWFALFDKVERTTLGNAVKKTISKRWK